MANIKCTYWTEIDLVARFLRRYEETTSVPCKSDLYYHDSALIRIAEDGQRDEEGHIGVDKDQDELIEKYKSQFPTHCEHCGHQFTEKARWQIFPMMQFVNEQGHVFTEKGLPIGAMWDSKWRRINFTEATGPDGRSLTVKLPPNGAYEWCIDSRASNCDMPCLHCGVPYNKHKGWEPGDNHEYEDLRPHKCWIRHGEPPMITVGKDGVTCGAGAGSIAVPNYHGFLINGELTNA